MKKNFEVLVIGGGVVGLAAALAMAKRQYQVALLDMGSLCANTSVTDGRVYALNQASENLLATLDVALSGERVSPYQHMHVWDATSHAKIDFDAREVAAKQLGVIIEESVLKEALLLQVTQIPSLTLFPSFNVTAIEVGALNVRVQNEAFALEGQLLMVADGAQSPSRDLLKVPYHHWSYEQQAVVATVSTEKFHEKTAYQVFLPEGPLALLPLANKNQCSIVWSSSLLHAKRLMAFSEEQFNTAINEAFGDKLGQISLMSTRQQFPLHMRHVKQYVGERWLLLGDCAHSIHPLAGLGLNVGLADLGVWLKYLDKSSSLISNRALSAYQRERKAQVWQVILLMEALKKIFTRSFFPWVHLRGLGLGVCDRLSVLKRFLIQQARGLS